MRGIKGMMFSVGLGVCLACSVQAQDAPKPAVQVIIGPDGSVRVIDAKTGKEISHVVTRVQGAPAAHKDVLQDHLDRLAHLEAVARQQADAARLQAHKAEIDKALEAVLRDKKKADPIPMLPKQFEIELDFGPGGQGQPRVIIVDKSKSVAKPQPTTVDQKLDAILKQLGDLRRDVNEIKGRLDGKQPADNIRIWRSGGPGDGKGPPGRGFGPPSVDEIPWKMLEGKLDAKQIEKLKATLRELNPQPIPPRKKAEPSADLERQLERLLREAEELRREIQKKKSK